MDLIQNPGTGRLINAVEYVDFFLGIHVLNCSFINFTEYFYVSVCRKRSIKILLLYTKMSEN